MTITYISCNPCSYAEELQTLAEDNYSDDPRSGTKSFDLDWDTYDKAYKDGHLAAFFAKDGDVFIGYILVYIRNHHHVQGELEAAVDSIYVSPAYRSQGVSTDLIEMVEETLIDTGVYRLSIGLRNIEMADKVVGPLGYDLSEVTYSKDLENR